MLHMVLGLIPARSGVGESSVAAPALNGTESVMSLSITLKALKKQFGPETPCCWG